MHHSFVLFTLHCAFACLEQSDSDDDLPCPPSIAGTTSQPNSHFSERGGGGPLVQEASTLATERRLTHRRDHGVQSRLPNGERGPEVYFVGECVLPCTAPIPCHDRGPL